MRIHLDYGRNGLEVELPDENIIGVLQARHMPPLADPTAAIEEALRAPIGCAPLSALAKRRKTACVVVCDITRPVPNRITLPPLLRVLESSGIRREDVTILIATGMHRPCTANEIVEMLGPDIARDYRVVNHHCEADDEQSYVGRTSLDVPVYVDKTYVEADLKIVTGLIEPHFMAGYSGGRKIVCPGIASLKTVQHFHSPQMLEDPNATTGVIGGNPLHQMALEVSRLAGVDFTLNVVIDEERKITGVFVGELEAAHAEGVRFVADQVAVAAPQAADIVVTTSAGYPLDATFYQTVKGMVSAAPVVKEGGVVLIACAIEEGIGGPEYTELQRKFTDPTSFLDMICRPGCFTKDQWQVEMFCKVVRKAEVWMYCENLTPSELRSLSVTPVESVEAGVRQAIEKLGPDAKILVMPSGPYVMPYIEGAGGEVMSNE